MVSVRYGGLASGQLLCKCIANYLTVDLIIIEFPSSELVHCSRGNKFSLRPWRFLASYCSQLCKHQSNLYFEIEGRYELRRKTSYSSYNKNVNFSFRQKMRQFIVNKQPAAIFAILCISNWVL